MRKIYIVGGGSMYANWMQGVIVKDMDKADLVLFTGGADVGPYLYGKKAHQTTWPDLYRDRFEVAAFKDATKLGKKMIGICRGAQFLCVMAGGILVQHQLHPGTHIMKTYHGDVVRVTSAHHQRQYPFGGTKPKFELLGWCDSLSPFSYGENWNDNMDGEKEVEVAVYPTINALAIQSHPEWVYPTQKNWEKKYINFCRDILNNHMAVDYQAKAA